MTAMLKTLRQAEFPNLTIAGGINSIKAGLNRAWPPVVVGVGLLTTAAWSCVLVYFTVGELLALI